VKELKRTFFNRRGPRKKPPKKYGKERADPKEKKLALTGVDYAKHCGPKTGKAQQELKWSKRPKNSNKLGESLGQMGKN